VAKSCPSCKRTLRAWRSMPRNWPCCWAASTHSRPSDANAIRAWPDRCRRRTHLRRSMLVGMGRLFSCAKRFTREEGRAGFGSWSSTSSAFHEFTTNRRTKNIRGEVHFAGPACGHKRFFGFFVFFSRIPLALFRKPVTTSRMTELPPIPDDVETCQQQLRELSQAHRRLQDVYGELLATCTAVGKGQTLLFVEANKRQGLTPIPLARKRG